MGDSDPEKNPRLRLAVRAAQSNSVPKDVIERAIKKSQIGNYGDFEDSELNYHFSAKDIIIKNNIFKKINQSSHFSLGINYINSNIENYSSSAIAMQLQFISCRRVPDRDL